MRWGGAGPEHPLCPQDTTDYVAYVAKDPINQRGDAGPGARRRDELGWGRCPSVGGEGQLGAIRGAAGDTGEASICPSVRPSARSLPHPGVLRRAGAERHQHGGTGLRAALQAVPAQPPQGGGAPGQVGLRLAWAPGPVRASPSLPGLGPGWAGCPQAASAPTTSCAGCWGWRSRRGGRTMRQASTTTITASRARSHPRGGSSTPGSGTARSWATSASSPPAPAPPAR